jgi:hypothetical protein
MIKLTNIKMKYYDNGTTIDALKIDNIEIKMASK